MDKEIRRHYTLLVDFLGHILGPDYEVALHELTEDSNQIIAISNGELTGRHLGSPLSNKMLEFLSGRLYETQDYVLSFESTSVTGKKMHSNSMFVKDRTGSVVGLLCINFDDSRYMELHEKLFSLIHPGNFVKNISSGIAESKENVKDLSSRITENFAIDVASLREQIFNDATANFTTPVDRLNQNERKEITIKLYEQGLFQLKGSIPFVAKRFSCSQATIYRYLGEINN